MSKRSRTSEETTEGTPKSVISASAEISFPRGGSSVLTPLEKKEISNEVKKDLLFSNKSSEPPKKKSKKSKSLIADEDDDAEDAITIDHLSFNLLQPGSLVLAQIKQISQMELVVSLADDITAFIPITNISDEITSQLEAYDDQDDSDSDMDIDSDTIVPNKSKPSVEFPELSKGFKIGQWISAQVISNVDENQKKKIELTIEPSRLNAAIESNEDITPNFVIQGSVKSIEDHGYILSFGKSIKKTGFIAKKDLTESNVQIGSVFLFTITKVTDRTVTCKMPASFGSIKKQPVLNSSNSVESLTPGLLINATVTETNSNGIVVKAYGICDGFINCDHLDISILSAEKMKERYSIGSNIKARIIAAYMKNGAKKLELSLLPQLLSLDVTEESLDALKAFPIGHVFDSVTIRGKDSSFIYIDVKAGSIPGRAHKSKIGKNDDIDLDFKIGSERKARILNYSSVDNCYIVTLNTSEIEQKYLRPQDIPIGAKVDCVIEKVTEKGINIKVEKHFQAFVDAVNISDIKLNYPERKFKVGSKFKGRLLKRYVTGVSTRLFVTFKKSLVNAEDEDLITDTNQLIPEKRAPATIVKITNHGCVCAFFNDISAFLPNSEISETFVHSAKDHVKEGQTVRVRIINYDAEDKKCLVSLRVSADYTEDQIEEMNSLRPGRTICKALIVGKERDIVNVQFGESKLSGSIQVSHLSDGIEDEGRRQLKSLKIGSSIDALVLSLDSNNRTVVLTAKPSLIRDANNSVLPITYKDIHISDRVLHGFVKSVIPTGVFVSFANNLTGLVIPKLASEKHIKDLTTVFSPNQSVKCTVSQTDDDNKRFLLSLMANYSNVDAGTAAINPVDKSIEALGDFVPGKATKASVKSIEENNTGLIVKLADNQEGRIDISEIIDINELEAGSTAAAALSKFNMGKKLDVKVLGFKNITTGAFRSVKKSENDLVELTSNPSSIEAIEVVRPLSFDDVKDGDKVTGYISANIGESFLVSVSPNLKVVIPFVDLSDDSSELENINDNYKIGTIVKATIVKVDHERHSIFASARSVTINTINDVKVDSILPGTVIKANSSGVLVTLGNGVTARADPSDCLDDYDEKIVDVYHVGSIVSVKVYHVDIDNRRINVLLRPSAVTGTKPKDRVITSHSDVKRGDVVRGFIIKFVNSGIIVGLGHEVVALVRIGDISDAFVKDWRSGFELYQVVKGKILSSEGKGRVLMTMKNSVVTGDLADSKSYSDLEEGQIYEGTVKKAMEYGVFVALDGTNGISGLCHRSEISDSKVENCENLFTPGDRVKVKILSVDAEKNKMSLGMKASYFMDEVSADEDVEMSEPNDEDAESEDEAAVQYNNNDSAENESDSDEENEDERSDVLSVGGLSAGFDWTASVLEQAKEDEESEDEEEEFRNQVENKKKAKKVVNEDKTADLATRAPQSVSDFERLLIGNPDSSLLWIQYMSFQLQLSEVSKAREIAERALKTINYREEHEKLNIWVAFLNLENSFGDDDSLEEAFKKSCQYMDDYTMHIKMVNIYIASEKFDKADDLFNVIVKKYGSKFSAVWVSYAEFLIDTEQNDEAHAILARALQILPKKNHIEVVRKFASLEFRKGDLEQGRSLFEGLLADVPKRVDLWNIYIDQELKYGDKKHVDDLFERLVDRKLTRKQAKYFFAKWLAYEEKMDDEKAQDYVKAKAAEYAEKLSK